jgi:hypothetical protein
VAPVLFSFDFGFIYFGLDLTCRFSIGFALEFYTD